MNFSVLVLCMFFLLSPSYLEAIPTPKNIFILGGQSNMAGGGGVFKNLTTKLFQWNEFIPPESQPSPSILRFSAKNKWEEAREPLHRDIDFKKTNGIGPGMSFANTLLAKAGSRVGVIGLVPCGIGGTHISNWTKTNNPKATRYYKLLNRIKASRKAGGVVRALFWLQGESDASNEATAVKYQSRLKKFVTDLRSDLKQRSLPIILVKIASFDKSVPHEDHNMNAVRKAQDAISKELLDVKAVDALRFIKQNGTGFNRDRIHLSIRTEVKVGETLANTYLAAFGKLL